MEDDAILDKNTFPPPHVVEGTNQSFTRSEISCDVKVFECSPLLSLIYYFCFTHRITVPYVTIDCIYSGCLVNLPHVHILFIQYIQIQSKFFCQNKCFPP